MTDRTLNKIRKDEHSGRLSPQYFKKIKVRKNEQMNIQLCLYDWITDSMEMWHRKLGYSASTL